MPPTSPATAAGLSGAEQDCGYSWLCASGHRTLLGSRTIGEQTRDPPQPYQVKVYFDGKEVAVHERELEKKYARLTMRGHHQPFERKRRNQPTKEEQTLSGNAPILDAYIAKLKKRAPGRGARQFKRLLHLKRTYPSQAFLAAIEQAEHYGLFDLERLERLILERVAGDFFSLDTFGE